MGWIRRSNVSVLQIDREPVTIGRIPTLSFTDTDETQNTTVADNEVQIGGVNTSDPRFGSYKSYSGCLSSTFLFGYDQSVKLVPGIHAYFCHRCVHRSQQ